MKLFGIILVMLAGCATQTPEIVYCITFPHSHGAERICNDGSEGSIKYGFTGDPGHLTEMP